MTFFTAKKLLSHYNIYSETDIQTDHHFLSKSPPGPYRQLRSEWGGVLWGRHETQLGRCPTSAAAAPTPVPIAGQGSGPVRRFAQRRFLIAGGMVAVHVTVERVPGAQELPAQLAVVTGGGQVQRLHMVARPAAVTAMFAADGTDVAAAQRVLHQHRLQVRLDRLTGQSQH